MYAANLAGTRHHFDDMKRLLAAATPFRSGDQLAGVAAASAEQRVAARYVLSADSLPLATFLQDLVIPYERDEVTRLIVDGHDAAAFAPISHLTVGGFREWLLSNETDTERLRAVAPGVTPEMAAAVCKLMRNQDLIAVGRKFRVTSAFRSTLGLPGRLAVRLQPNHPTDDPRAIGASIIDGLLMGCGDAVIGVNPASDSLEAARRLLQLIDALRQRLDIPTQSCVLAHVTNTLELIELGAPVDLAFQSIAGTEDANRGFGVDLELLNEAHDATLAPWAAAGWATMSCISRPARARRCRPRRITASTSRRWRRAPMRSPGRSDPCWSIPSSASSGRNICTTASKSPEPGWRITSAAS